MIATLRFAGDLPPLAVLAIGLTLAFGVVWYYLRETKSLPFPLNNLLPALRGAAVAAIVFILAGPIWHTRHVVGSLGRVIFAIDVSESMSLTDSGVGGTSESRLARATRLLSGSADSTGWLESLSKTHDVDVVAFSSGAPTLIWSSQDSSEDSSDGSQSAMLSRLSATGRQTDLASGMSISPADISGSMEGSSEAGLDLANRSAIVLMTDGRDTAGNSAAEVAARLASRGVAVHAVGFGSSDERPDVGIVDIERPDNVASDGILAGAVLVKQVGSSQSTTVRIEANGEVVWKKTLEPLVQGDTGSLGESTERRVPFSIDVEPLAKSIQEASRRGIERGTVVLQLKAVVETNETDAAIENNSMDFRIAATTRDRRLLILDGSSRWETRYIRNLFSRDPAWQVDTVMYGPGTDMTRVVRGTQPGQLPNSSEVFSRYDAVVLGEVPPDQFSEIDALHLREFVNRGGGLIVIDGRFDRIRRLTEASLADLIPVRYPSGLQRIVPKSLQPTEVGAGVSAIGLSGQSEQEQSLWTMLPAPRSSTVVAPQPGAEVWAVANHDNGQKMPWLVTRLFGAGRVFYLATDQTWRWRYKVADRFHARFWNQLLVASMQPPYSVSDQYVSIGTDQIEYATGQSATIRARLQDASSSPVGDATVDAILLRDGQPVATVAMSVDDPARGTYRAQTPPLEDGQYDIRIQASGFDASALSANTPIWVGSSDAREFHRVSLHRQSLEEIAGATKGQYVHESEAESLLAELKPLSSGMIVESDILVWQSFYWFWAVIVLLTIEWYLRKVSGLV